MEYHSPESLAVMLFNAALRAVDPYESVKSHAEQIRNTYHDGNFKKFLVIGFGKASYPMAKAVEDQLGSLVDAGIVITKYGHSGKQGLDKINVYEAGHPVPDGNGLKAANEMTKCLKDSDEQTLVVCLISGDGSALLVSPYEGISLADKQEMTKLLLNSGADIYELNAVRKHLSNVKGGRLAEIAHPSKLVSLILSDVIGDRLDVIASGPTSPDKTSYKDVLGILKKYMLNSKIPHHPVSQLIHRGLAGLVPETPKEDSPVFETTKNIIIGSNKTALGAVHKKTESHGINANILTSEIMGEAKEVGKILAQKALETQKTGIKPACLISGGETTVTVRGSGLGGRNMELALSFAMEIDGAPGITFLSAGTDGTDGPTDAAGAIVNGQTISQANSRGLNPDEYLKNNDSYTFFKEMKGLFITGPTGTNVMDVQIALIE